MHSTQKNYFEPRMPQCIGICNPRRNVDDDNADHRTALDIVQVDHETKWPIHTRRFNLFKQEQKEDQSFANGTSTCTTSARTQRWTSSQAGTGSSSSSFKAAN
jgi:hypothetical protein